MSKINKFQRDEVIKTIYKAAQKNKKIFFLSADFGAPALDNFRFKLKNQFIHLGICEQNMIDFASGMALEGAKVYVYAMAPFLSVRCYEQHKTATCLMNTNVCSIVTGIGLSYANSGPTHYSTEDFACLRALPNSMIFTASDPSVAREIARKTLKINKPTFIRLDRKSNEDLNLKVTSKEIDNGFRFLKKNKNSKLAIVSHGTIIERAVKAYNLLDKKMSSKINIIDLIQSKPFPKSLKSHLNTYKEILTIDEQTNVGSLGSLIKENVNNNTTSLALPDKFIFENLGRDKLLDQNNLSVNNIIKNIKKLLK
jgi:transketolase